MLNKIILVGRLTRDPELSYTTSGIARLKFSLAVERNYTAADGSKPVDFIDITCWRNLAETCNKYLRKGLMTAVSGSLQIRNYEGKDGVKRRAAEVVADEVRFLEWPKDDAGTQGGQAQQPPTDMQDVADQFGGKVLDNDLPF